MAHIPVLLNEVIDGVVIPNNGVYVDGTLGSAGHAAAIAKKYGKEVTIVGFDKDVQAIARSKASLESLGVHPILVNKSFDTIGITLQELGIKEVDVILLDLGISSVQLDDSARGFTFQKDEPLLMTMEEVPTSFTAGDIVNTWSEESIANIIFGYGEEGFARRIAGAIVLARKIKPIKTTLELRDIVTSAIPKKFISPRINPSTKTFQALRIAVNDELETLRRGLEQSLQVLAPGGRLLVITFHSLEDRIVKTFFRAHTEEGTIITKKPIAPSLVEVKENPRSRSAKLRIYQKK